MTPLTAKYLSNISSAARQDHELPLLKLANVEALCRDKAHKGLNSLSISLSECRVCPMALRALKARNFNVSNVSVDYGGNRGREQRYIEISW